MYLIPHKSGDLSSIGLRENMYLRTQNGWLPDNFSHEQSLVIETGKGLIVFNSCSHTGMANILRDIQEMTGRADIYAYVGGLHLFNLTDEELEVLCDEIKTASIGRIFTGHCTGDHAFDFLRTRLGERICQFSSGFSWCF